MGLKQYIYFLAKMCGKFDGADARMKFINNAFGLDQTYRRLHVTNVAQLYLGETTGDIYKVFLQKPHYFQEKKVYECIGEPKNVESLATLKQFDDDRLILVCQTTARMLLKLPHV